MGALAEIQPLVSNLSTRSLVGRISNRVGGSVGRSYAPRRCQSVVKEFLRAWQAFQTAFVCFRNSACTSSNVGCCANNAPRIWLRVPLRNTASKLRYHDKSFR